MSDSTDAGHPGDGFDDPTAPAWASPEPVPPTRPIPTESPVVPPSPYAAPQPSAAPDPYGAVPPGQDPYGQNPYGQTPYPPQPYAPAPYGQQPYGSTPHGQTPYGQQPYGSTAYGQPPYSMPPAPYGAPPARNTSAIVLTVVSAVTLVACCNVLAVPALILGIVGLTKVATDPQGSARMTRAGWITFGVTMALAVIGWAVVIALAASGSFDGSSSSDFHGF